TAGCRRRAISYGRLDLASSDWARRGRTRSLVPAPPADWARRARTRCRRGRAMAELGCARREAPERPRVEWRCPAPSRHAERRAASRCEGPCAARRNGELRSAELLARQSAARQAEQNAELPEL